MVVSKPNSYSATACFMTAALLAITAGCSTSPPNRVDDLCAIFAEKDAWYKDARQAEQRWGSPIPVLMAIIRHESAFRADARPPRKKLLWLIPGPRPSSAYGYPQALDSTWDGYRRATGQRGADRDDFADAVDFVGWYNHQSYRQNGISKTDARRLYLAYYSGHAGYRRGSYRGKRWLHSTATRVAQTAERYRRQLAGCRADLDGGGWWPFS